MAIRTDYGSHKEMGHIYIPPRLPAPEWPRQFWEVIPGDIPAESGALFGYMVVG